MTRRKTEYSYDEAMRILQERASEAAKRGIRTPEHERRLESVKAAQRKIYLRNKAVCLEERKKPCSVCGVKGLPPEKMDIIWLPEFKDPSKRSYPISTKMKGWSEERLREELKKTRVVCEMCNAKLHLDFMDRPMKADSLEDLTNPELEDLSEIAKTAQIMGVDLSQAASPALRLASSDELERTLDRRLPHLRKGLAEP